MITHKAVIQLSRIAATADLDRDLTPKRLADLVIDLQNDIVENTTAHFKNGIRNTIVARSFSSDDMNKFIGALGGADALITEMLKTKTVLQPKRFDDLRLEEIGIKTPNLLGYAEDDVIYRPVGDDPESLTGDAAFSAIYSGAADFETWSNESRDAFLREEWILVGKSTEFGFTCLPKVEHHDDHIKLVFPESLVEDPIHDNPPIYKIGYVPPLRKKEDVRLAGGEEDPLTVTFLPQYDCYALDEMDIILLPEEEEEIATRDNITVDDDGVLAGVSRDEEGFTRYDGTFTGCYEGVKSDVVHLFLRKNQLDDPASAFKGLFQGRFCPRSTSRRLDNRLYSETVKESFRRQAVIIGQRAEREVRELMDREEVIAALTEGGYRFTRQFSSLYALKYSMLKILLGQIMRSF